MNRHERRKDKMRQLRVIKTKGQLKSIYIGDIDGPSPPESTEPAVIPQDGAEVAVPIRNWLSDRVNWSIPPNHLIESRTEVDESGRGVAIFRYLGAKETQPAI